MFFLYRYVKINYIFRISESSLNRLNPLKLAPVLNLRPTSTCTSLLELFICSSGGQEARKSFARVSCSDEALAHWHLSLLPYLNHVRHIMYPLYHIKKYQLMYVWIFLQYCSFFHPL